MLFRSKVTYSLTLEEAGELFLVSAHTVKRWYDEALREPSKKTIGSLLKAAPPLMRYTDVTRDLVSLMDQMGFGGCKRVTRAGIKLSKETVRRYRKQPRKPEPKPEAKTINRVLKAKSPNHIWMMDVTDIPSAFKLFTFKFESCSMSSLASPLPPSCSSKNRPRLKCPI